MADKWDENNIGDLTGKIIIVTGANTGIGKETARAMAAKGARVTMAVRNLEKGNSAAGDILASHPESVVNIMELDLSSLESVKAFADAFLEQHNQLHFLINNAGVMAKVSPLLSNPDSFAGSSGNSRVGRISTPVKSRIV